MEVAGFHVPVTPWFFRIEWMTENELEVQVANFMKARGWRRYRNQVGVYQIEGRTQRIGTPGYPDWTFRRTIEMGIVEICHVETKARGKKPTQLQLEQIALLNHQGEPACWVDSMEKFEAWYSKLFSFSPASQALPGAGT